MKTFTDAKYVIDRIKENRASEDKTRWGLAAKTAVDGYLGNGNCSDLTDERKEVVKIVRKWLRENRD